MGCWEMRRIFWLAFSVSLAVAGQSLKTADAVLDRYVPVTGGAETYRRFVLYRMYSTVTRPDGTTFNTSVSHSRGGATLTEIDDGDNSGETGVGDGIAWEYSEKNGAKILDGKMADRRLAEARGLEADDWRLRFPMVELAGIETVDAKSCYHLKLTQQDGSIVERFYNTSTGLLVREVSTDFDETGAEQPVVIDIQEYDTWLGLKHPSLMRVRNGAKSYTIRVDSLTLFPSRVAITAFEVPREVVRAVAETRGGGALPNAVDIIEKFIQATGGRSAYQSISTEAINAEIAFPAQNVKFPIVMYAAKNKSYASLDIPSLGKFEFGNDGSTGWERSVVLGPRLQPHSAIGGFLGPTANDVLHWTESDVNLRTLAEEDVNGSTCYKVKFGVDVSGQPSSTAWFEADTGLLVKVTNVVAQHAAPVTVETTFSDYRSHGNFKIAHHIETKVAGQQAVIDIAEFSINAPLHENIFELPPDVRALRDKKKTEIDKAETEQQPTLKKHP